MLGTGRTTGTVVAFGSHPTPPVVVSGCCPVVVSGCCPVVGTVRTLRPTVFFASARSALRTAWLVRFRSRRRWLEEGPVGGPLRKGVAMASTTKPKPLLEMLEELVSSDDLAAAEECFASMRQASDERVTAWRRENYIRWRTGWNKVACRQDERFVHTHEEALASVVALCGCLHRWERTSMFENKNVWLGTYTRGFRRRCVECGVEDVEVTSSNNYSGD